MLNINFFTEIIDCKPDAETADLMVIPNISALYPSLLFETQNGMRGKVISETVLLKRES